MSKEIIKIDDIQSRIFTIRGMQVMLDRDLASLYGVETKVLNQAVKRNKERFLDSFYFMLSKQEFIGLMSHFVTSSWGGTRKNPYVFTETGVAMLSAVLKSDVAVKMSIKIMEAFVSMRHFMLLNEQIFQRLTNVEIKQLEADSKIEKVFKALESKELTPRQGIFFEGQIFDAYKLVSDIVRSAQKSIVLIDNYVDDTVLIRLT